MKLSKQQNCTIKILKKRLCHYFLGAALTSIASIVSVSANAQDNSLTVISWGGAYNIMQKKYVIDPFEKNMGCGEYRCLYLGACLLRRTT